MTDKSRMVIIIIVAMAIILAATSFAYSRYRKNVEKNASGGPHIITTERTADKTGSDIYYFDNILDARKLVGRTASDSGIDEKYFKDNIFRELEYEGKLFSKDAHGSTAYSDENTAGEHIAETAYIFCYELSFEEALEGLKSFYGEPIASGDEPYAEANGGAVSWAHFYKDGIKLILTQGSENDYIEIAIKNEAKG